jgi:hypothetical protein
LFFTGFLIYPLLSPKKIGNIILLSFSVSLAFVFNPNALLFAFPISLYAWGVNLKNWKFYVLFILSTIPVLLLFYWAKQFYVIHPEFLSHFMRPIEFKWSLLVLAIDNLNKFFKYMTPIFWEGNWVIILFILICGLGIWKTDKWKSISILTTILLMFVSLGVPKIHEDLNTIFLSTSRMFLAIPLILGLAFFWLEKAYFLNVRIWKPILLIIGLIMLIVKLSAINEVVATHTEETNFVAVGNKNIDDLCLECTEINNICDSLDIDLIMFVGNWSMNIVDLNFYTYGCDILEPNFKPNVLSQYERRTWCFEEAKTQVKNNVLIYGSIPNRVDSLSEHMDCRLVGKSPNVIWLKNNKLNGKEIAKAFNFKFTRNPYLVEQE